MTRGPSSNRISGLPNQLGGTVGAPVCPVEGSALACRRINHDAQERYPDCWTLCLMLGQLYPEFSACLRNMVKDLAHSSELGDPRIVKSSK